MINKLFEKSILFFGICILHIIYILSMAYAGTIFYEDNQMKYITDNGIIASNSWIWLDPNNDSIAECYHFGKNGKLSINYESPFNQETNEEGQLIENGVVIKKMLSSGKIIKSPFEGNVDSLVIDTVDYDNGKKKKYAYVPIKNEKNGVIIKMVEIDDTFIGPVVIPDSGIIYTTGKSIDSNESVLTDGTVVKEPVVAGKNIKSFIVSSKKCNLDVDEAYIYGGIKWKNVIELRGNGSSIKINLKKNNYIYFEVANEMHYEDEKDILIYLDMYVDGKLFDSIEDFVDGEPLKYDEYFYDDEKTVELKLRVEGDYTNRRVYIRNGRLRKLKLDED